MQIVAKWMFSVALLTLSAQAASAAPWDRLFADRGNAVEADPNKEYWLQDHHGPWLIMAATFSGHDSMANAKALTLELRERYKMEAFMMRKEIDLTGTVQGNGVDKYGRPKVMKHMNSGKFEQIAVLAGQFGGVDDPRAERTLEDLKNFHPRCLKELESDTEVVKGDGVSLRAFRNRLRSYSSKTFNGGKKFINRKEDKGMLANAFLVPNPILGEGERPSNALDPFIYKMNKDLPYTLLENQGKFTVVVATFRGFGSVDQKQVQEASVNNARLPSRLEEAANNAFEMTEHLRKTGVQAYQFHDKEASVVCVGSFDWVVRQGQDGQPIYNPAVQQVIKTYGQAYNSKSPDFISKVGGEFAAKHIKTKPHLVYDVDPLPVEVPRAPISAAYENRRFGLR